MTVEPVPEQPAPDCQVVNCAPPLLSVAPDQEQAPRLGRPAPGDRAASAPEVAVVEVVSPFGPITEDLLQRPRQGRPVKTS
jgi:hypothetical protein